MKIEPYQGDKDYVFLSYAHADEEKVEQIVRQLSFRGLRIWYDEGIRNESWRERLAQKIIDCRKMIVMLSQNYMDSRECNRELELADVNRKEYIIIRLDDAKLKGASAYILSALQYKDATVVSVSELVGDLMSEKWTTRCTDMRDIPILEPECSNDPSKRYWNGEYWNKRYQEEKERKEKSEKTEREALWGPERRLYENGERPPFAVFNSEKSERFGDERQFLEIREQGEETFVRDILLKPGKTYEVRFLFHNNATTESNRTTGAGMATALSAAVRLPLVVFPGRGAIMKAGLRASVIQPEELMPEDIDTILPKWTNVWAGVQLRAEDQPVFLKFKIGTAKIKNSGKLNDMILPSSLFSDKGAYLGYNKAIGNLPGGEEYAGYVYFQVEVYDGRTFPPEL